MKDTTKSFLDKSARAIEAAETLLANDFADFARAGLLCNVLYRRGSAQRIGSHS
jgi:hypothetical protein